MVVGVEDVDVGLPCFEFGIERQPEDAAIPQIEDVGAQIGEGGRGFVVDVFVAQDLAGLLGDEQFFVRSEPHGGRVFEPLAGDEPFEFQFRVLEARGKDRFGHCRRRLSQGKGQQQGTANRELAGPESHSPTLWAE